MGEPRQHQDHGHDSDERLLVSAREAARLLGVSERTLWGLTRDGEIPHVRVKRRVLYSPDDLRTWIVARKEGGQ